MDQQSVKTGPSGYPKLFITFILLGVVVAAEVVGAIVVIVLDVSDADLWFSIIPECIGAAVAVAGTVALGGQALAKLSGKDIAYTFRFGWWCMAISVAVCVIDLYLYVSEGTTVVPEWPQRLFELALFCLAIGIFEEFVFRGLIFNGLLAVMGKSHRGVVWAVMLTSLLFGMAHIDFELDIVDGLSIVQAMLKIVQTGMYSIMLCVIFLHTHKLMGVSLFHGLDDFVIMASGIVLFNESADVEYVAAGDDAIPTIVYYLFIIVLYIPFVVKSLRELKRTQVVWQGAFMNEAPKSAAGEALSPASVASSLGARPVPLTVTGQVLVNQGPSTQPWTQAPTQPAGQAWTQATVPAQVQASAQMGERSSAATPVPVQTWVPAQAQAPAPVPSSAQDMSVADSLTFPLRDASASVLASASDSAPVQVQEQVPYLSGKGGKAPSSRATTGKPPAPSGLG